ncbi:phage tail tape measure protein [Salmonella enterica subsp. enterica serovar Agbeni]|uniref:Phage tail tape measure protein n=1 Tax=Salmonella enterica subsp. enterica serovar Agbeni TaxID=1967642 RepID=A0A5X8MT05_SALET|nr:phage tail tape measure protein [Salmonella enterica subsp. enterica serovar Agbeni]HCM2253992.1 phage tail tape measure protein [Salmonella enterica subsp. enterica serovar Agbeni]
MSDSFQLKAIITGVDKLSPILSKISKNAAKNIRGIVSAGARAGASLAGGLTMTGIAFAQQEDAMIGLKTAMMDSSGGVSENFKKISDLAVGLGNKLPGTTADFEDMMTTLTRQGIPVENILAGVGKAAAYMAVQMKMSPSEAAEQIAKLQDATKTLSKDMLELADATQRAYYMGVNLGESVQFYGAASPVLGMVSSSGVKAAKAFEPFNVMLNQAGMDGSAGGNAMRKIMQGMMNMKKMQQASSAGGVNMQFTSKGEFAGIDNMFAQLDKLKGLDTVHRMAALRKGWGDDSETLQALNTLITKGATGYKELQERMAKQASLNQRVEASLGTLKNMWDAATGSATNAAATIGSVFAPQIKKATEWIGELAVRFDKWAQENPDTIKTIAAVAAAIAGVGLALKAVNGVLILMNMNPVVLGIVAAAAAIAYLVVNWDKVVPAVKKMWNEFNEILSVIINGVKKFAQGVIKTISDMVQPVIDAIKKMWEKVQEHTPDFILKFFTDLDSKDGVSTPSLPPINASAPAVPTIPPLPDYTRSSSMPDYSKGENSDSKIDVTIKYENAPPGTRSTVQTAGPAKVVRHDVGYSSFSSQYAAAMSKQ